jgi:hypothetical protein
MSLYNSGYSRSSIHLEKKNADHVFVKIGLKDFFSERRLKEIRQNIATCDVVWVMSPSHILVIPLRILTRKSIILDAGWPLADSTMTSNDSILRLLKKIQNYIADLISFHFATKIILETEIQVDKVSKKYILNKNKLKTIYTGVNESRFQDLVPVKPREIVEYRENEFVLFRGKYNREAGLLTLMDLFRNNPRITIIMAIPELPVIRDIPSNVTFINRILLDSEIKWLYENAVLALGQFGSTKRQQITIPHKYFEAAYFGCPYLSPETLALNENLIANSYIRYQESTSLEEFINHENLEKISNKSRKNYNLNLSNKKLSIEKDRILEDLR